MGDLGGILLGVSWVLWGMPLLIREQGSGGLTSSGQTGCCPLALFARAWNLTGKLYQHVASAGGARKYTIESALAWVIGWMGRSTVPRAGTRLGMRGCQT